jgi:hypothetical protein
VTSASTPPPALPPGPPTKHQLALMIWVAVFPTLTVLNLALPLRGYVGPTTTQATTAARGLERYRS